MSRKNKEEYNAYMKEYVKERYHQLRNQAILDKGGRCQICGSDSKLEFDHIDPNTKKMTIAKIWSFSEEMRNLELSKCQLLCNECHKKKTLADFGRVSAKETHGTLSSYKYCKCKLCKSAKADYMRTYKKNRKS